MNKTYKNGQIVSEVKNNILTYYFKTGIIRAKGKYVNDSMEGKWIFNRENGQLWQIGNFKNNKKHGKWIRYNREGNVEYDQSFIDGKIIKNTYK